MKKGDFVKVAKNAYYTGQDMRWTEQVTGKKTYKAGAKFYHFSDRKLNSFLDKKTCFFDEDTEIVGHCYVLTIERDMTLDVYSNEVRINLDENSNIQYIGKIRYNFNKRYSYIKWGRSYSGYETIDNRLKKF